MKHYRLTHPMSRLDSARFVPRKIATLVALAVSAGVSPSGFTQSGAAALEEVVVTATRRSESVQDVAMSISALSESDLADRGISSFTEIQGMAPSLYLDQSANMTTAEVFIRGVGTTANTPTSPSVGVVVDGVYQLRLGTAFTELYDVQRVEVLRGPQGTLFGKNTTAGLISITTNDPVLDEFSGKVQGVAGNLDAREVRGLVNVPLVEDTLGLRVGAYTAQRDGYTENVFVDEDTATVDRQGYRAKLLWSATDSLQVMLAAEKSDQKSDLDQAVVEYAPGSSPDLPLVSLGRAQQQHSESEDEYERYVATIDWLIGDSYALKSISAWEDIETFYLQDRDGTAVNAQMLYSNPQTEVFTQEVQFTSDYAGPANFIVGLFYQDEELISPTRFSIGSGDPFLVSLTERDQTSQALFGNVSYEFTQDFDVSVGARYTEDEKVGTSDGSEQSRNFDEWTYSLKARYHLDTDKMLYASYDHGFKSGGVNRVTLDGLFPTFWEPEFADNYEIGLKSQWLDSRLRFNASLFYTTFEDFQVTQSLAELGTAAITNAGEVSSMGIETDFMASITENFSLSGSVAFIETEYDQYADAPCNRATPQPGCSAEGLIDLSGETKDHSPEWTVNLGAEYRNYLTDSMEWFVRGDYTFRDEMNLDPTLDPANNEDARSFIAARAGIGAADGQWQVAVWGKNLSDEEYVTRSQFNSAGHLERYQGLSRTYGLTVDWNF